MSTRVIAVIIADQKRKTDWRKQIGPKPPWVHASAYQLPF